MRSGALRKIKRHLKTAQQRTGYFLFCIHHLKPLSSSFSCGQEIGGHNDLRIIGNSDKQWGKHTTSLAQLESKHSQLADIFPGKGHTVYGQLSVGSVTCSRQQSSGRLPLGPGRIDLILPIQWLTTVG